MGNTLIFLYEDDILEPMFFYKVYSPFNYLQINPS